MSRESAASLPVSEPLDSSGVAAARVPAEPGGVMRQVAGLMLFQVLSPGAALLSEIALAWRFGASGIVDAYRVTVLLLIYGQQLFVTHILPCTLVPVFAEYRARQEEGEAWVLADSVAHMLLLFGGFIAALLFIWPGTAVTLVAPGLAGDVRATAVFLIRWCGIAFIPMCWTGAACGILYAYDIFQIAPLAQFASNMVVAAAIAFGGGKLGASSLALGLVGGSALSTGIHVVQVARLRRRYKPKTAGRQFDLAAIRKAVRIGAPLVGSVIAGQSTSVVINRVLSRLPVGTIAAFGYALKMGTLVRLGPTTMVTVLFPKFSAAWYSHGRREFTESCARAIRATIYIAVPVTVLCWAFRRPLIAMLFERGAFTDADVTAAAVLFGLLILNGPAATVTIALGRAFYAVQDSRTPLMTDVGGNLLELACIPILAAHYGARGAAAAYTLIPWVTASVLFLLFRLRFGKFPSGSLGRFTLSTVAAAVFSGWVGVEAGFALRRYVPYAGIVPAAVEVVAGGCVALALFFAVTLLLGFGEARSLRNFLRRSVRRVVYAS